MITFKNNASLTKSLVVVATIAVLIGMPLSLPVSVVSTPLPVQPTHLGVPVGNLVTLRCVPPNPWPTPSPRNACPSFHAVDTTGIESSTPYAVPAGETLIITDLDWLTGGGSDPGYNVNVGLWGCVHAGCAFSSFHSALTDLNSASVGQVHFTGGIRFTVVPIVELSWVQSAHLATGPQLVNLQIHGYLTP